MQLSKPDIFHIAIVGLVLLASAIAVPLLTSREHSQTNLSQTPHHTHQPAQLSAFS